MRPIARFVRRRLRRRIFVWFGASILVTLLAALLVGMLHGAGRGSWYQGYERARGFVGQQFALVWDDAARRDALARSASEQLGVRLVLSDARGHELAAFGPACHGGDFVAPVRRAGRLLGEVRACGGGPPFRGGGRGSFLLVLFAAGATLWGASGVIARRLTRPFEELVRVANEIGRGSLASRVTLRRGRYAEIDVLANAINDMAGRIQKQISDQRELLAAVSHEIRSPLSRMRLQLELARDAKNREATLEQLAGLERELVDINELTGKLLASSRLDFAALESRELEAKSFALGVLERAGAAPDLLDCQPGLRLFADPTLVARALSNLLENAARYGAGATRVRIAARGREVEFVVEDAGPGFQAGDLPNVFESFVRGKTGTVAGSLGLGLALVRRIALAHGGRVWAKNRQPAGAEVGFSVAIRA